MSIFRQFFDADGTSTLTYLIACEETMEGVIIDPVLEHVDRDLASLEKHGINLTHILETHIHADHITGAASLRKATNAKFVAGVGTGLSCSDIILNEGDQIKFGNETIKTHLTPGHTNGCVSYVWNDRLFTGDAILINACGRTDFQEGSPEALFESMERLLSYPDETLIYPGHDYSGRRVSSVWEQKATSPFWVNADGERLSKTEFVNKMNSLKLAYPKRIEASVPANQRCGETA